MPENLASTVGERGTIVPLVSIDLDSGAQYVSECYRVTVIDPAALWIIARDILVDGWAVAQIDKATLFVGAEIC